MTIDEIKELATKEITEALSLQGMTKYFRSEAGEPLNDELEEGFASIEWDIHFKFGNCEHKHALVIGWNEDDGVGLEYGEDGDIETITLRSIMRHLYFDLALKGLDDKYCA